MPIGEITQAVPDTSARLYLGDIYTSMIMGNLVHTSTVLLRRERMEKVKTFDETLKLSGEDYDFHLRTCKWGPVALMDISSIEYQKGPRRPPLQPFRSHRDELPHHHRARHRGRRQSPALPARTSQAGPRRSSRMGRGRALQGAGSAGRSKPRDPEPPAATEAAAPHDSLPLHAHPSPRHDHRAEPVSQGKSKSESQTKRKPAHGTQTGFGMPEVVRLCYRVVVPVHQEIAFKGVGRSHVEAAATRGYVE